MIYALWRRAAQAFENSRFVSAHGGNPDPYDYCEFYGFISNIATSMRTNGTLGLEEERYITLLKKIEGYLYYLTGTPDAEPPKCYAYPQGAGRGLYVKQRALCAWTAQMENTPQGNANAFVNCYADKPANLAHLEISGYQCRSVQPAEFNDVLNRVNDIIDSAWKNTNPSQDFKSFFTARQAERGMPAGFVVT